MEAIQTVLLRLAGLAETLSALQEREATETESSPPVTAALVSVKVVSAAAVERRTVTEALATTSAVLQEGAEELTE